LFNYVKVACFIVFVVVGYIIDSVNHLFNAGLPWSWSYGSWFYNYLCNQCLSPL